MLKHKGVLAFVLPEAILSVAAHDTVRRLIIDSCSFRFISYLGNVFSGVQCPSIILGITPDDKKTVVGCKVSTGNNTSSFRNRELFPMVCFLLMYLMKKTSVWMQLATLKMLPIEGKSKIRARYRYRQ